MLELLSWTGCSVAGARWVSEDGAIISVAVSGRIKPSHYLLSREGVRGYGMPNSEIRAGPQDCWLLQLMVSKTRRGCADTHSFLRNGMIVYSVLIGLAMQLSRLKNDQGCYYGGSPAQTSS